MRQFRLWAVFVVAYVWLLGVVWMQGTGHAWYTPALLLWLIFPAFAYWELTKYERAQKRRRPDTEGGENGN